MKRLLSFFKPQYRILKETFRVVTNYYETYTPQRCRWGKWKNVGATTKSREQAVVAIGQQKSIDATYKAEDVTDVT